MIRLADINDKMACIGLLKQSHTAAGFSFPFKAAYASALFDQHLDRPDRCTLLLEHQGLVQGLLMATWSEHPFGAGRYANETVWYIAPLARGRSALQMLDAYEKWAKQHNCAAISMASLHTNDVSRIYQRRGYAPAETHFLKPLI